MTRNVSGGGPECVRAVNAGEADPDWWFPPRGTLGRKITRRAVAICAVCPVREKCLADCLEWEARDLPRRLPYGVFGGKTAKERIAILKQRRRA